MQANLFPTCTLQYFRENMQKPERPAHVQHHLEDLWHHSQRSLGAVYPRVSSVVFLPRFYSMKCK